MGGTRGQFRTIIFNNVNYQDKYIHCGKTPAFSTVKYCSNQLIYDRRSLQDEFRKDRPKSVTEFRKQERHVLYRAFEASFNKILHDHVPFKRCFLTLKF